MPIDVKICVDKTFSVYPVERAEAAFKLGVIGENAWKSVPFLMRLLDDNIPVWCQYNGYGMWTTPGKEAAKAISLINQFSAPYLSLFNQGFSPYILKNEFMSRNLRSIFTIVKGVDSDIPQLSASYSSLFTKEVHPHSFVIDFMSKNFQKIKSVDSENSLKLWADFLENKGKDNNP